MKKSIVLFGLFIVAIQFTSCEKEGPRYPISNSRGEFLKESVQRNKALVGSEEEQIQNVIKNDSTHKYYQSSHGFWYKYLKANVHDTITPKPGQMVDLIFEIQDIDGNVIYNKEETTPSLYQVDKQEIMVGLRHGIKLMRKGETISFIFPSHMGYGYLGDKEKIGLNEPLICVVTLKDIKTNP